MNEFINNELYYDLLKAYKKAAKHKRGTVDEYEFEMFLFENLRRLTRAVDKRTYEPGASIVFVCREPVVREIFAATFADRVVHHLLALYVEEFIDSQLVEGSCSCRVGKGTDSAVDMAYDMARRLSNNFHDEIWVFKGDFSNYFYSLEREALVKSAMQMLNRQSQRGLITKRQYGVSEFLWHKILLDNPCRKAIRKGDPNDWKLLPRHKSLFNQPKGVGLPIGNYSSQMISNVYCNDFDRFVVIDLGYANYVRYVDDFVIFMKKSDKGQFLHDFEAMERYLTGMKITLNPKKCSLQPFDRGVKFLGAHLAPYHIVPSERIVKNFRKKAREVAQNGRESDIAGLISLMGRLKGYNARKIEKTVFDELGWDYQYPNYNLKVHDKKLRRPNQRKRR